MENNFNYQNEVLRIGVVYSVKGRSVEVLVDKTKNVPHLLFNGKLIRNVSVGSYIKINKGFERIIGIIESEIIKEDKFIEIDSTYHQEKEKIQRILQVKIVGYLEKNAFEQGVKELPLIDNLCYILTKEEYDQVHAFIKEDDVPLTIGHLASETSKEIALGVNSLFASHIGIFGNTGSGKSYSLASLYNSLFNQFGNNLGFKKNAKFLLIDFNGEYSKENSIISNKKVYKLTTRKQIEDIRDEDKLPLDESIIFDLEVISILSEATEKTQKPFIKRVIEKYEYTISKENPDDYFKGILKNKFKSILQHRNKERSFELIEFFCQILSERVVDFRDGLLNEIEWHDVKSGFKPRGSSDIYNLDSIDSIENLKSFNSINKYHFKSNKFEQLIDFMYVQIIEDLLVNRARNEHISPAINKLKSKTKDLYKVINFTDTQPDIFYGKNLLIIDLNDVKIDIKKTIPLLVAYKAYANQKITFREYSSTSLNIIIDEAHNILSYASNRESETWKDYRLEVFEEIIKEGRKFGTFLTIASQRPSDISSTIISQLHNYFLHRLINNKDIEAIERTVSYLDRVSFESLPILPTGTCIVAGLAAKLPVVVKMRELDEEFQPNSQTIKLTEYWGNNEEQESEKVEKLETQNEEDDDLPF